MRTRQGFTLIELLVVISIIAILAGLLLPAITSAREKASQLEASNNVKQISQAMYSYQEEYKSAPRIETYGATALTAGQQATVVPIGMELLATTQELPFKLFNSPGSGVSINTASRTVSDIQTSTGTAWSADALSFGWDWSAPSSAPSKRATMSELPTAWGGTKIAVVYGDHSVSSIENANDSGTESYVNANIATTDDIHVSETGNSHDTFQRGERERAFIRFDADANLTP